jgi:alpha-1,2-mannosyltransferase
VSSVLERLGAATAREKVVGTRVMLVGVAAFVIILGGWLVYAFTHPESTTLYPVDLGVYRNGGLIVRHVRPPYNGTEYALYDWPANNQALKFTYTPFAALFFAVVSFVPWSVLPRLTQVANLIFLFIAAWCTMGALGYRDRRIRLGGALLGSAVGLLTEPVFRTMYLGQINLLLMAAIIWDLRQPDTRRWKGIATGLAAAIKLTPLVFIPYLILTKKFKAAAVVTGTFLATVVLGFVIIRHDSGDFWWHGLFINDGRTGFVGATENQSLRALTTRLFGSIHAGTLPWLLLALVATVVGLWAAAILSRAGHAMLGLLTAALVGLLDSPISWDHHWVWVVPGMMVAAHYAVQFWQAGKRLVGVGCAAVGAALLLIFAPWPGSLWGVRTTGPGNFTKGLIWAGPYSPVKIFIAKGDLPSFKEYHWAGLQNLSGNAYILTGIALLVLLVAVALRSRRQPGAGDPAATRPTSTDAVARPA